jgi:hypothetical protein
MAVLQDDLLSSYEKELVHSLLRLRQENPLCWQKMAIQINEQSEVKAPFPGSIVHWLDQSRIDNNKQN